MAELHQLGAAELAALYRRREASPVEVVRAVIAHIERCEPKLQALYAYDPEAALAAARASEARWIDGAPLSAIDGVPGTLKENIASRGTPVPVGTAASLLVPASEDAPPAARWREAGAVLLAKTTMPDYGMLSSGLSSFHPLTRNPWDLTQNPGGSSAGAGAAAAAGYGPLHVGTDIGGSIRLPAGWCGVFGFKPSLGRIPIKPPFAGRVAGPMTRTVADAALLMAELSKPDWRDAMSLPYQAIEWARLQRDVKGLRLGLQMDAGWGMAVETEVRDAIEAAARVFERAGAIVESMPAFSTRAMIDGMDRFWRMRSWLDISALPSERRDKVLPYIRQWVAGGSRPDRDRGVPRLQPDGGAARRRGGRMPAVRLRAVAGEPGAQLCRRVGEPPQRPAAAVRAHRVHAAVQHERAAGRVDQLRLHRVRPADRAADHRPPAR